MRAAYRVLGQTVPDDFAQDLRRLYVRRAPNLELGAVFAAAKHQGWTWQAMGDALGISRERVRQLAAVAQPGAALPIAIPDPPRWPDPVRPQWPKLTEEQAEQLRDLNGRAAARGFMPDNHPAVVAAREVAALIQTYLDEGHRLIDLARALGVSTTAIHFRLGRWGYRSLPPSQISKGSHPDGRVCHTRKDQDA